MSTTILDIPGCIILEIARHLDAKSCWNLMLISKFHLKLLSQCTARIYTILNIRDEYHWEDEISLLLNYFKHYPEDIQWLITYSIKYPDIIPSMLIVVRQGIIMRFEGFAEYNGWLLPNIKPIESRPCLTGMRIRTKYVPIFISLVKTIIDLKRLILAKVDIARGIKAKLLKLALLDPHDDLYEVLEIESYCHETLDSIKYVNINHPDYNKLSILQKKALDIDSLEGWDADEDGNSHEDLWEKLWKEVVKYCGS